MSSFSVLTNSEEKRSTDRKVVALQQLIADVELLFSSASISSQEESTTEKFRSAITQHLRIFPSRYSAIVSAEDVIFHMKLLSQIGIDKDQQYIVSCLPASSSSENESGDTGVIAKIVIICADIPKIFNHINTVLEQLTLSTIEASIMSTTTGLAFDEFVSKVDPKYTDQFQKLEADINCLLCEKSIVSLENVREMTGGMPSNKQKQSITRNDELKNSLQHHERSLTFAPIQSSEVQIIRKIGAGQVCETFEGVILPSNLRIVVKKPLTKDEADRVTYMELWKQELTLMELIGNHENICKFIGMSQSMDTFESMFLCYEYLPGGNLSDVIMDTSKVIDPLMIAYDIAKGMAHLHRLNVMHRDLKPANVILDSAGSAKIADFGLSCQISAGRDLTAETGTYRWMAPEVIRHEQYSLAADVYSFGVLLWGLYARSRPFNDLTPCQAAFQVAMDHARPPIPRNMPPRVKGLLNKLWHRDASLRPIFDDICTVLCALIRDQKER